MLAQDLCHFTYELVQMNPDLAEVFGLTGQSTDLLNTSTFDIPPSPMTELAGFKPSGQGMDTDSSPLFGPDGYPLY